MPGDALPDSPTSTIVTHHLGASGAPSSRGVLIVESDPDLQWQLARMLTQSSCVVVGTSSSDGALAVLSSWRADVLVVAEDLPGMNGLELVRHVRSRNPGVPILLLANDGPGVDDVVRTTGATEVLQKPVKLEDVRGLVLGVELARP